MDWKPRTIKFKIWHPQNGMISAREVAEDEISYISGKGFANVSSTHKRLTQYYPYLVMLQFTGVYDSQKLPIYEGDIIRFVDGDKGVVEWDRKRCGFSIDYHDGYAPFTLEEKDSHCLTIIGNVFENEDLLNG